MFGAFCTEAWHFTKKFYGTGDSFVFGFGRGEDLKVYSATSHDDHY